MNDMNKCSDHACFLFHSQVDDVFTKKLKAAFQKLEAATDSKSLLKKYLTFEVFEQLKDRKTALGVTLLDVIQSGTSKILITLDRHEGGIKSSKCVHEAFYKRDKVLQ